MGPTPGSDGPGFRPESMPSGPGSSETGVRRPQGRTGHFGGHPSREPGLRPRSPTGVESPERAVASARLPRGFSGFWSADFEAADSARLLWGTRLGPYAGRPRTDAGRPTLAVSLRYFVYGFGPVRRRAPTSVRPVALRANPCTLVAKRRPPRRMLDEGRPASHPTRNYILVIRSR